MLYYDFPDAYDLFFTDDYRNAAEAFFAKILQGKNITEVLDCAVGSGQLGIPLAKLGLRFTGSDINPRMLRRARENFARYNLNPQLVQADFTCLSSKINRSYDMVACTGNSLAHVEQPKVLATLKQMDSLIKPGGTIFIDSRNWDAILKRQQRFYLYNPLLRDRGRVNFLEVWDYNRDGSMTFNLLYFEELENRVVSKRQFYTIYFPLPYAVIKNQLTELGYTNFTLYKLGDPTPKSEKQLKEIDWYALTAIKPLAKEPSAKTKLGLLSKNN